MDNIDTTLIQILRKDSRTPFLKIAKSLNVSEGTIRKRVKKLISSGDISKFTITTKEDTFAIIGIETQTKTETKKIVDNIKKLNVENIYEVTGRFDIICMIPSERREKINETLEQIRSTSGVTHTETFTVLLKS
jgi:Lrp/AsnC family transcriptional regulator, regulator for asnA, asnC and gidA